MGFLLCCFICWSLSVSPCWSYFCPIPALYANIPAFYSVFFPLFVIVCCCTHNALMEGGGLHGWQIIVHGFAREIILLWDLMCQPEARCEVLVWIPVPQGTGESISTYHTWVWSRGHDYDLTTNPSPHVQNGFIRFCCNESTQICEYNQVFPP